MGTEPFDLSLVVARIRGQKICRLLDEGRLKRSCILNVRIDDNRHLTQRECVVLPWSSYRDYMATTSRDGLLVPEETVEWDRYKDVYIMACPHDQYRGYLPTYKEPPWGERI